MSQAKRSLSQFRISRRLCPAATSSAFIASPSIPRRWPERIAENIAIFDFALSDAEMDEVFALARPGGRLTNFAFAPKWD